MALTHADAVSPANLTRPAAVAAAMSAQNVDGPASDSRISTGPPWHSRTRCAVVSMSAVQNDADVYESEPLDFELQPTTLVAAHAAATAVPAAQRAAAALNIRWFIVASKRTSPSVLSVAYVSTRKRGAEWSLRLAERRPNDNA
jgi:hypothetical protein